jgi:hypothetical protein
MANAKISHRRSLIDRLRKLFMKRFLIVVIVGFGAAAKGTGQYCHIEALFTLVV